MWYVSAASTFVYEVDNKSYNFKLFVKVIYEKLSAQLASREKRPSSRRHIKSSRSRNGPSPTKGTDNNKGGKDGNKGNKGKDKTVHRTNSKSNK